MKQPEASAPIYPRADVCRMLGITERQLRAWEKKGFIEPAPAFGFNELLSLKTLCKLKELKVPPKKIESAVTSLKRRLSHIHQPLAQLRITVEGRNLAVHISGDRMEPVTGQLLFDFDKKEIKQLRAMPVRRDPASTQAALEQEAEFWFQRGLTLEETGAPLPEAINAYRKAIDANPHASGALVNLGTISFRLRRMKEAEIFYRRAIDSDPTYSLAHFNLGNLYDEQGNFAEARKYYEEAVRLNPRYADAWFNLALLCERNNQLLKAIGHWQTYLKLDSTSSWAGAARKQLDRLKKTVLSK